jgi:hypothetical protein
LPPNSTNTTDTRPTKNNMLSFADSKGSHHALLSGETYM